MDDIDRELLALEQRIAAYRHPRLLGAAAFMLAVIRDIEELLAGDPIRSKRSNAALRAARDAIRAIEGEQP